MYKLPMYELHPSSVVVLKTVQTLNPSISTQGYMIMFVNSSHIDTDIDLNQLI